MARIAFTFVLILAACGPVKDDEQPDAGGQDAAPACVTAAECDDGNACTTDTCEPSRGCAHAPVSVTGSMSFAFTGALQTFTVPACVLSIRIDAKGAKGGDSSLSTGGNGAAIAGMFAVTPGQQLSLVVGGQGGAGTYNGGGGGGSFVWATSTTSLMLAAGGGGGAGYHSQATLPPEAPGVGGQTTNNGTPGGGATAGGGVNGNGGTAVNAGSGWAGGGTGWLSGGEVGNPLSSCPISTGGSTPLSGAAGGLGGGAPGATGNGGYGGGGGAQGGCNARGGGGGGGYSGGGGGYQYNPNNGFIYSGGGGGGSFNAGTNPTETPAAHNGDGALTLTW